MEAFSAEVVTTTEEESSVEASLLAETTRSLSWTAVVDYPSPWWQVGQSVSEMEMVVETELQPLLAMAIKVVQPSRISIFRHELVIS